LGFSVLFMSLAVEKDVLQRKVPWMTLHLFVVTCSLIPLSFIPIALVIAIIWWIVALAIAIINVSLTYLNMIIKSQGAIRKITSYVLFGFLGTYLFVIFRDFTTVEFIFNGLAIVSAVVFLYGITKT